MTNSGGRILVVDDEETIRNLVVRHLSACGHACEAAADGRHALALASTGAFDVVLSDIEMPGLDGLGLAREIARTAPSVPVILVSGKASLDHAVRAMRYGVCDLLLKPFHLDALDEAIGRAVARRRALREADDYRRVLQKRIEELSAAAAAPLAGPATGPVRRTDDSGEITGRVRDDVDAALTSFVDALEDRGMSPRGHGARTRTLVAEVTRRLGLPREDATEIARAALAHEIGFTALPDAAACGAPGPEAEAVRRQHVLAGAELLRRIPSLGGVAKLVEAHHEHFDGSGYPRGLRADQIPFGARLVCAAAAADEFLVAHPGRGRPELEEFLCLASGTRFASDAVVAVLAVPAETIDRIWAGRDDPAEVDTSPVAV